MICEEIGKRYGYAANRRIRLGPWRPDGGALSAADFAVISRIENHKRLTPEQRLDEAQLVADIQAAGTDAYVGQNVDDIVAHVVTHVHPNDVLLVMSNGGFGGIHNKLLIALAQ